ncbi:MAG TPA: DDE-type integrase/transposase/recombinase [Nitrososphaeraceae archaeon]|nr:DDE-type integrase/transposase/recombinase [Nitrososphaeraceae archaeon]
MKIKFERNKTSTIIVMYSLYLYFLGLSLRNASMALIIFKDEKRSHVSVWNWIQRFASYETYRRRRVSAFIIDETIIQIGNQHFWLWFCIEPIHSLVLGIYISEERNMFVAEKFIRSLVQMYGRHPVYTDGGTWYPQACNVIGLKHHLHSPFEKHLMERVNQYFKDRTEGFDDYYPCIQKENECNLFHVYNWIQFFVSMYNSVRTTCNDFNFEFNGGEVILS